MTRMLPPYVSSEVKSTGERQIFDLFKNAPSTEAWVVMHSLGLSRHVKRLYGEIDFLVLAPHIGVFCLEVKSGEIRREEGIWKFVNRFGEVTTSSRSPFQQAEEAMFSLLEAIKKRFGEKNRLSRLLYGFGVMFPHVLFQLEGPEIEAWQIYDRDSRRFPIRAYVEQLSRYTQEKVKNSNWFSESESLPTSLDIDQLVSYLRGDFEKLMTPKQMVSEIEQQLNDFTEEQYRCLDGLQDNPRCLFQGAAGTGKTMIAMESVRRGSYKRSRTLMVCFNSLLGNWLYSQFVPAVPEDLIAVSSFHRFLTRLCAVPDERMQSISDKNEFFRFELPLLALETIDAGKIVPFDRMVVDEGQDLLCPEYLDVFDALLRGGLAGGNWELYCDFERQAIYSESSAREMLEMLESRASFARFRLSVNCRNTRPIGEEISIMSGFEVAAFHPSKIEGIPVEYHFFLSGEEEVKKLEEILTGLRQRGIPASNITILSPFRMEMSVVARIDRARFRIVDLAETYSFPVRGSITFSTIHSFKGLENSYIVITDVSIINDDEHKSLLYVGMSRAKVGLTILMDSRLEKEYRNLLKKVLKAKTANET